MNPLSFVHNVKKLKFCPFEFDTFGTYSEKLFFFSKFPAEEASTRLKNRSLRYTPKISKTRGLRKNVKTPKNHDLNSTNYLRKKAGQHARRTILYTIYTVWTGIRYKLFYRKSRTGTPGVWKFEHVC